MYCLLVQKAKMADQGTAQQKMLSQKGRVAVDKALLILAKELNVENGSLAHSIANTASQLRIKAAMQFDMQTKILQKIASQQTQDKECGKSTGIYAGLLEEDSPTMKDSMPNLTKTEQLQIMQDKADNIVNRSAVPSAAGPAGGAKRSGRRGTLLILERSLDPITPLLIDFSLEALGEGLGILRNGRVVPSSRFGGAAVPSAVPRGAAARLRSNLGRSPPSPLRRGGRGGEAAPATLPGPARMQVLITAPAPLPHR